MYNKDKLPIKVDGTIVAHKETLKKYKLPRKNTTLYTAYQSQANEGDTRDFADWVDAYCEKYGITNPYTIQSMNTKSRGWADIVDQLINDESVEDVVNHVYKIAISDDRNSMKACELLAQWKGIATKQEVSVKADATVNANVRVAPELFELPSEDK